MHEGEVELRNLNLEKKRGGEREPRKTNFGGRGGKGNSRKVARGSRKMNKKFKMQIRAN